MKKILVINVNWLGDVVFSAPVFKALKENYPQARIFCLAVPRVKEILECIPEIDEIIIYDEDDRHVTPWAKLALIWKLRQQKFDAAFILHGSLTRALFVFWAGIPIRVGYGTKKRGHLLTHELPLLAKSTHRCDSYLGVIEGFGVKVKDRRTYLKNPALDIERILQDPSLDMNEPFIVVNPGGNWDLKRWPTQKYKQLVQKLVDKKNRVVITGGAGDVALAEEIVKGIVPKPVILAGKTSLKEMMAILAKASLIVSADSGPSHLANSLGVDTLVIFGPTRPEITGPRGLGRLKILQNDVGCNREACYFLQCPDNICMRSITVQKVYDAIQEFQDK